MVEKENFLVENLSFKRSREKDSPFSTILLNPQFLALQPLSRFFHKISP